MRHITWVAVLFVLAIQHAFVGAMLAQVPPPSQDGGRYFSSERIAMARPVRAVYVTVLGDRFQSMVWSYDCRGFVATESSDAAMTEPAAKALVNTLNWADLRGPDAQQLMAQLLRGRPAESWVNAGAALLRQGEDAAGEKLLLTARSLSPSIAGRIDELRTQVAAERETQKKGRAKHEAKTQPLVLTHERAKLFTAVPFRIEMGRGKAPIAGWVRGYDSKGLYMTNLGSATEYQVAWSRIPAEQAWKLLSQFIAATNAGGWFRAGRLLLDLPEGERWARLALERAHELDPALLEPIQVVWQEHRSRSALAKNPAPSPADSAGSASAASGAATAGAKGSNAADRAGGAIAGASGTVTPMSPALPEGAVRKSDARDDAQPGEVRWVTRFDCGMQHPVKRLGPAHFLVQLPGGRQTNGFFLFRLEGVAGQTVRVEFRNAPLNKWGSLNPVYTYAGDLADPTSFAAVPASGSRLSAQGVPIPLAKSSHPDARNEPLPGWHYMSAVWSEGKNLALIQHFPKEGGDAVYIAMKYPYTPQFCSAYFNSLEERERKQREASQTPDFHVERIGASDQGRPLWVLMVGTGLESKERPDRPTVLVYAREHGDEHDSSWPAQGLMEFLLADNAESRRLRQQYIFLIAPMVDPDAAANNVYEDTIRLYRESDAVAETLAWAGFFHRWMLAGNRLDLVLNIHNVESGEGPHVFPAQFEPSPDRKAASTLFNDFFASQLQGFGYTFRTGVGHHGISRYRLGGHLQHYYGALHLPYEVNSQSPDRHLNLHELKVVGPLLARSVHAYFSDRASANVQKATLAQQIAWRQRMERYGKFFAQKSVIGLEQWCLAMPSLERRWREQGRPYPAAYMQLQHLPLPQPLGGANP